MNRKKTFRKPAIAVACLLIAVAASLPLVSQDAEQTFAGMDGGFTGVVLGGEVRIGTSVFIDDLADHETIALGNLASAIFDVEATGANADAFVRFRVSRSILSRDIVGLLDEASLRIHGSAGELQGGLMKLTWGKADSQGPLDVVNPTDFTDLTVTDSLERKIARPMLRASISPGAMTRIEGVFVPSFAGNAYATEGPWKPAQIAGLDRTLESFGMGPNAFSALDAERPTLRDFQGGFRFTTTTGSLDWGLQYYYGMFADPSIVYAPPASFSVTHDRFHQAGADFAAVVLGLNVRGEAAAFLTEDQKGDDPAVRDPEARFSLGVDKVLPGGLSFNAQYGGRSLFYADENADRYSSQLTAKASLGFFKDNLVFEATAIWEIEAEDYLVMPAVSYKIGDAAIELAGGIFGGKEEGTLGQFKDSSYIKAGMSYVF